MFLIIIFLEILLLNFMISSIENTKYLNKYFNISENNNIT